MLGSALFKYFSKYRKYECFGTIRSKNSANYFESIHAQRLIPNVDVEDFDGLVNVMRKIRPNVVVNCVGLIKQLKSSEDPLNAIPINSLLPHRLANLCDLIGSRLIHISTDCVFSGSRGSYTELDMPDAIDLYGRSKYLGEISDRENVVTLRTSIIGHELTSNLSLVDWFLSQEGVVNGFRRAIYSGLPTVELARVIDEFVLPHISLHGLYHISANPINKYELLKLIRDVYKKSIEIVPDDTFQIDRSLSGGKFQAKTGYIAPYWEELIRKMYEFR